LNKNATNIQINSKRDISTDMYKNATRRSKNATRKSKNATKVQMQSIFRYIYISTASIYEKQHTRLLEQRKLMNRGHFKASKSEQYTTILSQFNSIPPGQGCPSWEGDGMVCAGYHASSGIESN